MSGGTDSSVAARLLIEQGYRVKGISFLFADTGREEAAMSDAASVCRELNIEHQQLDARELFQSQIIDYFVEEYLDGRTPFPCARCNPELKWKLLIDQADQQGFDHVSMGHYAQIAFENGHYFIRQGVDPDKDQSFFLWGLTQDQLRRILFPLGTWLKSDVRAYAAQKGMHRISKKKDSLGVCFLESDYRPFLIKELAQRNKVLQTGNFVDEEGNVLGQHQGYPMYTVGQRRGLGIYLNKAVFVKAIDPVRNEVLLSELSGMYRNSFTLKNYQLVDPTLFGREFDTIVRIRYRKQQTMSRIEIINNNQLRIHLSEAVDAIAPGQTAVFYREGKVLGGGFIE